MENPARHGPAPVPRLINKDPRNQQAVSILFMAAAPLALAFFQDDVADMAANAVALLFFAIACWWLSLGLRNRRAYDVAIVARRPRVPFLIAGSTLMGLTLGVLVSMKSGSPAYGAVQAVLGILLCAAAFGIDPLRDKALNSAREIRAHAAGEMSDIARQRVVEMRVRLGELDDVDVTSVADEFARMVDLMLKALADDPDRYRELRRHLGLYLEQTVQITARFVMQFRSTSEASLRTEYLDFVASMTNEFRRELQTFASGGRDAMDVQLAALRGRMRGSL